LEWPAGCSPQIACGLGTGPVAKAKALEQDGHQAPFCRNAENSARLYTDEVRAGRGTL
jgi:hypothetical protein